MQKYRAGSIIAIRQHFADLVQTMAKTTRNHWNPEFISLSPLFFPLQNHACLLSPDPAHWPTLEDYQALLAKHATPPSSLSGAKIRFVPQSIKPPSWKDDYEPRIYLKGEVQTRLNNWHDFFQVLVWSAFPRTKTVLNAKHYQAIRQRKESHPQSKQRSASENALTQFDECGAIIVSCDNSLLQLIREFRWKTLFWQNRSAVKTHLRCFVFGHAVYEKALKPYIGLTAHAVLFLVEPDFFHWPLNRQLMHLDAATAQAFEDDAYTSPRQLQPFPLLGVPDWDSNNSEESYYDNHEYFRPGRK